MHADLTQERVKELFLYAPESGELSWRVAPVQVRKNSSIRTYKLFGVNGRSYRAHRLIWLYMTGKWPTYFIDHKDGNHLNNRWENLREATPQQNVRNQRKGKGTNRLKGASFDTARKLWFSSIKLNGKTIALGRFQTDVEAHKAYVAAAQKYFGEFARAA